MCILGACVGCVGLHGLVMSVAASPGVRSCRRWHICKVWCLCGGCMEAGGMVHICMCDRWQGVCTVTVHLVEFGCGSPMRVSGRAPVEGYMLSMTQHFKSGICLCVLQAARAHGCLWCVCGGVWPSQLLHTAGRRRLPSVRGLSSAKGRSVWYVCYGALLACNPVPCIQGAACQQ